MTAFAVGTVTFCKPLWVHPETRYIADQLCRSATSTGANYRVACRARSKREFISKIGIALEEADESVGWFEVIEGAAFAPPADVAPLVKEARELVAILATSRITASAKRTQILNLL
ncbi:MAG: four helix bundle protein [Acidobacteriota bacterium]|nr:four helix bundle protein [Acidobacteriota bacterium]